MSYILHTEEYINHIYNEIATNTKEQNIATTPENPKKAFQLQHFF